jgi:hypothetical protein
MTRLTTLLCTVALVAASVSANPVAAKIYSKTNCDYANVMCNGSSGCLIRYTTASGKQTSTGQMYGMSTTQCAAEAASITGNGGIVTYAVCSTGEGPLDLMSCYLDYLG